MTNETELNQAIEFIRKKVIMASHPEAKSYDEALKKELGFGCKIEAKIGGMSYILYGKDNFTRKYLAAARCDLGSYSYQETNSYLPDKHYKIIGQPLTLSRILHTIRKSNPNISFCGGDYADQMFFKDWDNEESPEADWDLNKTTLQDQEPETILAISKLIGNDK